MDNVNVQRELTTMMREASGISPNTRDWTTVIDQMFDRGIKPSDIIARARFALSDDYHRQKFLDTGARYIDWNFNKLATFQPARSQGRARSWEPPSANRHQRWEVELHKFSHGRSVSLEERKKWLEIYMSEHSATAYEMETCPICTTQR